MTSQSTPPESSTAFVQLQQYVSDTSKPSQEDDEQKTTEGWLKKQTGPKPEGWMKKKVSPET